LEAQSKANVDLAGYWQWYGFIVYHKIISIELEYDISMAVNVLVYNYTNYYF